MKTLLYSCLLVFVWKGAIKLGQIETDKKVAKAAMDIFEDSLKAMRIRFPNVLMSQMLHETGDFTSAVYKENHNCVGMKWNSRGYATGVNRGHATYPDIWHCLHDYAEWQAKYCPASITTDEEYIDWLIDFGYAEDKSYAKHIRRLLKVIKS